jgi:hypothetical protein
MAKNILVATSQPAFGELLRLSLEESSRYRVRLVQTGREALISVEQNIYSLVILDAGLADPPFSYVVLGLRGRCPAMRLLVIPSEGGEDQPAIRAARPDGCVSQPFYAPSLLEMINHLTEETAPQPGAAARRSPTTVEGGASSPADQVAGVLEEFLKDTTAPAVLVLRASQPWAWAGQFNRAAYDEVAALLARYAKANEGVDTARFVHLQSIGGEYLIFATPLPDQMVLVMVYPITTPLTIIRAQAMRLARLLRPSTPDPFLPPTPILSLPLEGIGDAGVLTDEGDDARLEADAQRLMDFLAEMPAPNPAVPEPSDWVREDAQSEGDNNFFFPWELQQNLTDPATPRTDHEGAISPEMVAATLDNQRPSVETKAISQEEPAAIHLDAEGELADSPTVPSGVVLPPAAFPDWLTAAAPPSEEDTRPVVLRTLQSLQQVEPIMPSFSHLAYTCLLIPRLPAHMLVGGLADRLKEWLPQLCLAYGWRLENLLVRPEYMQWTVQVAPAISPGNVIRLVRQQASRRIFLQFPQYEVENPSSDFWAPGFLIISGFQPPSTHLVQEFIRQTRTRQGNWTH